MSIDEWISTEAVLVVFLYFCDSVVVREVDRRRESLCRRGEKNSSHSKFYPIKNVSTHVLSCVKIYHASILFRAAGSYFGQCCDHGHKHFRIN